MTKAAGAPSIYNNAVCAVTCHVLEKLRVAGVSLADIWTLTGYQA